MKGKQAAEPFDYTTHQMSYLFYYHLVDVRTLAVRIVQSLNRVMSTDQLKQNLKIHFA